MLGLAQAIAVTTSRIRMQLRRNPRLLQRHIIKHRILDTNRVVLCHGQKSRRMVCRDLDVGRNLVTLLLVHEIAGMNHDIEVGAATNGISRIHQRISSLWRAAQGRNEMSAR